MPEKPTAVEYHTVPLPLNLPWTTEEALVYLRMDRLKQGPKMLSRWVQDGRLKRFGKAGKKSLFLKEDLDAFVRLNGR